MVAGFEPKCSGFDQLDPRTLYQILRLRVDAFVVEQDCPYPELDGRDAEPGARHLWCEVGGDVVGYLRVLAEADGTWKLGRVVTRPANRGTGVGAALMHVALDDLDGTVVLDAQSRMAAWYERFGFEPSGPEFVDYGIPHIPMRLVRAPVAP